METYSFLWRYIVEVSGIAIASTSMLSVTATEHGVMSLRDARHITPETILERLGGLPDRKYHCSVLGHQALREAVMDYEEQRTTKTS